MKRVVGIIALGLCTAACARQAAAAVGRSQGQGGRSRGQDRAWPTRSPAYKLCQSMDKVAAIYLADAKKAGKDVKPVATPACADPGPFAYTPPAQKPLEAAGAHSPPGNGGLAAEHQGARSDAQGPAKKP